MPDLFESLTPAQIEAVQHVDGPLLILAGPGSGKTRVVTHRIAHLISQGIPARQILALTFTNKAAEEMRNRVAQLVPDAAVWTSTFHKFCARLLRKHAALVGLDESFTIFDTADSQRALKLCLEKSGFDATHYTPERIAQGISWAKNNLLTPEEYHTRPGNPLARVIGELYPAYQAQLLSANAVDFDDLLCHVARILRDSPELRATYDERFRYILVDEYQDTNLAQYSIVRALSIDHPDLSVTGDPDQSIYGWRGANLKNILEFERDYPGVRVVRLEQNYRSTKRILRAAQALISCNVQRKEKALFTENDEGRPIRFVTYATHREEADQIAEQILMEIHAGRRNPRDFAIFYRVNALSRALEHALREHGIPYQMVNGLEFYQRKEVKDILAYLQLLNNPRNEVAFLRIINTPPRGIGKSTLSRLREHADRYGLSLFDAARESGLVDSLPKKAAVSVARFMAMYDQLGTLIDQPVKAILQILLEQSSYKAWLEASENPEDQDRLANIEELLTAAHEFDDRHPDDGGLEAFLEEVCLANETDDWQIADDRVTLMTMHASKGLEFPVVFIVAMEEGLIPHERSREREDQLEEERRLLFVGITRARQELFLSRANVREFRGVRRMSVVSQFLMELPKDEFEMQDQSWSDLAWHQDHPFDEPAIHVESDFGHSPVSDDDQHSARLGGSSKTPLLTTAADLARQQSDSAVGKRKLVPPEAFRPNMSVLHPAYGLGTILAISGSGVRRVATVYFQTAGEKRFVLLNSDLQPLSSG